MIVHNIEIRESGPAGLIAVLEPHDFARTRAVEARLAALSKCCVDGCGDYAWSEMTVHRVHSRRVSETVYVCEGHIDAHCVGATLRLRVDSHR